MDRPNLKGKWRKIEVLITFQPPTVMPNSAEPLRCPYCRDGSEFRLLVTRTEGWLQCEGCGHNAMPLDPEFKCTCLKCDSTDALAFMTKITEAD